MQRVIALTSLVLLALVIGTSDASAIDAALVAELANGTIVLK